MPRGLHCYVPYSGFHCFINILQRAPHYCYSFLHVHISLYIKHFCISVRSVSSRILFLACRLLHIIIEFFNVFRSFAKTFRATRIQFPPTSHFILSPLLLLFPVTAWHYCYVSFTQSLQHVLYSVFSKVYIHITAYVVNWDIHNIIYYIRYIVEM